MRTPPAAVWLCVLGPLLLSGAAPADRTNGATAALFAQFALPDEWQARFWNEPGVKELLDKEPKALAELVPVQAGVRFSRCPACDAPEDDDPLVWSPAKPKVVTCRRCRVELPNDKIPAKDEKEKKVPEETIEVLPQLTHHYPYHVVDTEKQRYPDERVYVEAKRDYEARAFLAKATLYAAARAAERPAGARDRRLTTFACTLLLRFAQVYPAYATHYDQPNEPKYFQSANLAPPYRRGFKTAKWDSTGSLDVPLNLVIAYALLRDDPALTEVGRLLDDPNPRQTIEHDLFHASAQFVRLQPDDFGESSLQAYRGMLAVGRLLSDPVLIEDARTRLTAFAERGFYHDGFWRQGDSRAHDRVLSVIDGWINRLLASPPVAAGGVGRVGIPEAPMLALARAASGTALRNELVPAEVQLASWPQPAFRPAPREPRLLGGVGLARLAAGQGNDAVDLDLRGLDGLASPHFQRLSVRLSVGGHAVLGDLDDVPTGGTGWEYATAAHNTVVVDGLNQRESATESAKPVPGADVRFFAADRDLQVVSFEDRYAYPNSTTRYRHTIVVSAASDVPYAVSVFEVEGGLQHDQFFHAAPGFHGRWDLSVPQVAPPPSLLPASITYVPTARAEDGRWFVQAYGELSLFGQAHLARPSAASLLPARSSAPSVRLHILGDGAYTVYTASSRDAGASSSSRQTPERAGLIVRRRSTDGAQLRSTFVTVFEPTGAAPGIRRVGRVSASREVVVLYVETAHGAEHLIVNSAPGRPQTIHLADGRQVQTDGTVLRIAGEAPVMAGGSFAHTPSARLEHTIVAGRVRRSVRSSEGPDRGWFDTNARVADPKKLVGRTLAIRHGDGSAHGWTIRKVEPERSGTRFHVAEEPGFLINDSTDEAQYYQFPRTVVPGPHECWVPEIVR